MRIDKNTTFEKLLFYIDLLNISEEKMKELYTKAGNYKLPKAIAGVELPDNFSDVSFGNLLLMFEAKTFDELLTAYLKGVLNIEREDITNEPAINILAFMVWVSGEVKKIKKLFDTIKTNPSPEEIQAGIEKLNHGSFGSIDWYALRMGFTDHDEAGKTKWGRVYSCMKMDNESNKYQKRLREIMSRKK